MRRLGKTFPPSDSKRSPKRRRVKPIWRNPILTAIAAVVLIGGSASVTGWRVWKSGLLQENVERAKWMAISGTARTGFSVREIFVEGRYETGRQELLQALRLKRGAPILSFDPVAAKNRVEALPWVRAALIERQLPDVVYLRLHERRPMALWQRRGRFSLIDTRGETIPLKNIDQFANLIVIVGKDAPSHAAKLFEILASEPQLATRVKAAVRVGGRRWNLHLENKINIQLPENDAGAAWSHLAKMEKNHSLLERNLITVDMRLPDRIVVREAPYKGDVKKNVGRDT